MPLYEYICTECKAATEDLKPVSERYSAIKCPVCGAAAEYNPINTGTSFSIKGAGVYQQGHPKYKTKNRKGGK